jgi:DNA-binding transcriptional ArsR family regulator
MTYHTDAQFAALGDATRRAILARLGEAGPLRVSEIARAFPVSRPAVSQHLRILKDADLVVVQTAGAQRLYAVNPAAMESLRSYFDQFWRSALLAFKRRVESGSHKEKTR